MKNTIKDSSKLMNYKTYANKFKMLQNKIKITSSNKCSKFAKIQKIHNRKYNR